MMSTESNFHNAKKWEADYETVLIPDEQSEQSIRKVRSALALIKKLWQNVFSAITSEPELRIWQKQDRHGRIHWYAYDPLTNKSLSFASELEMLRWLEDFHSRSRW
jgi:hypothetical protein